MEILRRIPWVALFYMFVGVGLMLTVFNTAYTMGHNHALKEVRHDLYFALNGSYDTYYVANINSPLNHGDEVDLQAGRCFPPTAEVLITRWLPGSIWQRPMTN